MGINNIIYLAEVIVLILFVIICVVIFEKKHKKGLLKFLGLSVFFAVIIFDITYMLERPEMELQNSIILDVGNKSNIQRPKTMYHFKDITNAVDIDTSKIQFDKIGDYEVYFTLDTSIGKYIKAVDVKVVDRKEPEIILEGNEDFKQSYSKEYVEPGFSAIDNYDGDITKNVKISKEQIDEESFRLIYEVEDSSFNKTIKIRNVKIVDDIAPVITLNGNENMTIIVNSKYEEKGANAQDEKDGNLTNKIVSSGKVDTSKEGTYTIEYKVKDKSGNEAVKVRTIKIVKNIETVPSPNEKSTVGNGKIIYLTFDDGPSIYTSKLLDILKKYNVKATFFVTGSGSDSLIKREYDEGHTVGLHTNSHVYSKIYTSIDSYFEDLYAVQARVERITGYKSYIMRFPGGSSNTVSANYDGGTKIMSALTKEVENRGFTYFDWNVSSGDAGSTTSSDGVYRNVVRGLGASSSVVLQHDIKSFSVNAVERIIQYGLNNGYTFKPLTSSSYTAHHRVNN